MKCNDCNNANICLDHIEILSLGGCTSGIPDRKVITNADRIRNMSDEELGDLLQSVSSGAGNGNPFISLCVDDNEITMNFSDIYEWLQSEARREYGR